MAEMSAAFWQLMSALGLILLGLLIWAAFSPFETLGWWAGWFGDKIYDDSIPPDGRVRAVPSEPITTVEALAAELDRQQREAAVNAAPSPLWSQQSGRWAAR